MRNPVHVRLGAQLKAARVRARRTQKELARMAGVAETTVARYEVGIQPPPDRRLRQFAELLNAPELIAAAESRSSRVGSSSERTATARPDLFATREGPFDWWSEQIGYLRHKERLLPSRVDAIRAGLSRSVLEMLENAQLPLERTPDSFLLDCLKAFLPTFLRAERLAATSKEQSAA